MGSKLCSSHNKLEFHLHVLRVSKNRRERGVRVQLSKVEDLVVLLLGYHAVLAPALEFELKWGSMDINKFLISYESYVVTMETLICARGIGVIV